MKIDTTKIEGFDGMTDAEKVAALTGYDFRTEEPADVQRLKESVSKANTEAANWKKQYRDTLGENERAMQELKERLANAEDALKANRLEKAVATNKAGFLSLGMDESTAKLAAEAFETELPESFWSAMSAHKNATEKKAGRETLAGMPRPANGESASAPVDYDKKIAEAYRIGDTALAAHYMRVKQESLNK